MKDMELEMLRLVLKKARPLVLGQELPRSLVPKLQLGNGNAPKLQLRLFYGQHEGSRSLGTRRTRLLFPDACPHLLTGHGVF